MPLTATFLQKPIPEDKALTLFRNIDAMNDDQKAKVSRILRQYKAQQDDLGEPLWPSETKKEQERQEKMKGIFSGLDKVDQFVPNHVAFIQSAEDPDTERALVANQYFLSKTYGKSADEIDASYPLFRQDFATKNNDPKAAYDDKAFYSLAQKKVKEQNTKLEFIREAYTEGAKAALLGEPMIASLSRWQLKVGLDRISDTPAWTSAYQKVAQRAEPLQDLADRMWQTILVDANMSKGGNSFAAAQAASLMDKTKLDSNGAKLVSNLQTREEMDGYITEMASKTPGERKIILSMLASRVEKAGLDQKSFWAQVDSDLQRKMERMESNVWKVAQDMGLILQNFPANLAEGMTGNRDFGMTDQEVQDTDLGLAYNELRSEIRNSIRSVVSNEIDPVKPVIPWLNDTIETGLIQAPGAVLPSIMIAATTGFAGSAALFTMDFAEQNRLDLIDMGMDRDKARKIATMAAPIQAFAESASNLFQLGRFANVQKVIAGFTAPISGKAGALSRYALNVGLSTGVEFTEEQFQDNFAVPVVQEMFNALKQDAGKVDWDFYSARAMAQTPELLSILVPTALFLGGAMTSAQIQLSKQTMMSQRALELSGFSSAQANSIRNEVGIDNQIKKARELWRSREGNATSMEFAAKELQAEFARFAKDKEAHIKDLEERGRVPIAQNLDGNRWRLTFVRDESSADFDSREQADAARWQYMQDNGIRLAREVRQNIAAMESNATAGREFAYNFIPETRSLRAEVEAGTTTEEKARQRVDIAKAQEDAGATEQQAFDEATSTDVIARESPEDELASWTILGKSVNSFKEGVLRTTMDFYNGSTVMTLVEEKLEGDAKAIIQTPNADGTFSRNQKGFEWMLRSLRAYEQASGYKLFRESEDSSLTENDLVEAWSKLGRDFFAGTARFESVAKAGLVGAMNAEATFWSAVMKRAAGISKLRADGAIAPDLIAELEKQLGISTMSNEQQIEQEKNAIEAEARGEQPSTGSSSYAVKRQIGEKKVNADEARRILSNPDFIGTDEAIQLLGEYPQYLDNVAQMIVRQREKLLNGKITRREVAKAYILTQGSIGSDGRTPEAIEPYLLKAGLTWQSGRDDIDMFVGQNGMIRPEELTAWWLGTKLGQRALDRLENGDVDIEAFTQLSTLRTSYGKDNFVLNSVTGLRRAKRDANGEIVLDANGKTMWEFQWSKSQNASGKGFNLADVPALTAEINATRGDPAKMEALMQEVNGISNGKKGFISHMLGLGNMPTVDAMEMNWWVTGEGDATLKTLTKTKRATLEALRDNAASAETYNAIFAQIEKLKERLGDNVKIPVEALQHILHHWIWDRAKGLETTHKGMYQALTSYSIKVQTVAANVLADIAKVPGTLSDFYVNKKFIPMEADKTAGGGWFGESAMIPAQGGPAFPLQAEYMDKGVVWASSLPGYWRGKLNQARSAGIIYEKDKREYFLVAPYAMKDDSHTSNATIIAAKFSELERYIAEGRISAKQEKQIADLLTSAASKAREAALEKIEIQKQILRDNDALDRIKHIKIDIGQELDEDAQEEAPKKKQKKSKDAKEEAIGEALSKYKKQAIIVAQMDGILKFPTKFSASQIHEFREKLNFPQRKWIADKLSSAAAEKIGVPPMDQVRRATLDPSTPGISEMSIFSLIEIDVKRLEEGLEKGTLKASDFGVPAHGSYDTFAPGRVAVHFRSPIPYALGMPTLKKALEDDQRTNHAYYLKGRMPTGLPREQEITKEMQSQWNEAQTSVMPLQAKAVAAALTDKWIEISESRQAGVADFVRALKNNDAAITLTRYSEKEVNDMLKQGKMRVFRLPLRAEKIRKLVNGVAETVAVPVGEIWFALKRPDPSQGDLGNPESDWTIVSVMNNEAGANGMMPLILHKAISSGGVLLDCFAVKSQKFPDGLLPALYSRAGFKVVKSAPFDPSYFQAPGDMGELVKVWESQGWHGQEKPGMVWMQHERSSTTSPTDADSGDKISVSRAAGRGMAGGSPASLGTETSGSVAPVGGEGQARKGRGLPDRSGATGNAGNDGGVLPRGNSGGAGSSVGKIIDAFRSANDSQLAYWGLTRAEADEAVAAYDEGRAAGATYSIGRAEFRSRMAQAFSPFQRSPDIRIALGQIAHDRVRRVGDKWVLGMHNHVNDIDARYEREIAILRRALEDDEKDIRNEREFELKGAVQNRETPQGRERIRRDFDNRLKQRRIEFERDLADIEKRRASELGSDQAVQKKKEMLGALRTLEAALSAAPPEVRAKVGGFTTIAALDTPEAMLKEIEKRVAMMDVALTKFLKKEGVEKIESLFEKARADFSAGKKAKGKLGADEHYLFQKAEEASKMDATALAGALAALDAQINSGNLSPEQEALALMERGIVELVGDLKSADAGRVYSALEELERMFAFGKLNWKAQALAKKARRELAREDLLQDTGKDGLKHERSAADKIAKTMYGKTVAKLLSLSSFQEILSFAFGEKSVTANSLADNEREASNEYEDSMQRIGDDIENLFTALAGGNVLAGEKLRFSMSEKSINIKGEELSQLEAIQARLMWLQEDGKRHMEGQRDENGNITSTWAYDQQWIDDLTKQMTPEALSVMQWLMNQYRVEHSLINPLYRARYGVNLPSHDNYAPLTVKQLQVSAGQVVDPNSGAVMSGSILTPSAIRTRSRLAVAEPDFKDALATFIQHKRQINYWAAYYDLATEMNAILGNRDLMNAVHAKAGPEAVKQIRRWIDHIAQGGTRDAAAGMALTEAMRGVTGRAATVGLLGRFSTLLVQSTQLAAASVKMPTGAFIRRFGMLISGNMKWGDAIRSEFIQRRYKSAPPIVRQAMENLANATEPNAIKRLSHGLGQILSGADALFTSATYAMLLDYHLGEGAKLGLAGSDLDEYAHNAAARDTEAVAQPVRFASRSMQELTTTHPLAKITWAYQSEARQKMAMLAWATLNAKSNPAYASKVAFLVFVVGGLMTQILKNVWRDMGGDDDEEKWSPGRLIGNMLAAPLNGLPMIGPLIGEGDMLSGFARTKRSIERIGDWDNPEQMLKDADTILSAMGLFNDTASGVASLSHMGLDAAKLLMNIFGDD